MWRNVFCPELLSFSVFVRVLELYFEISNRNCIVLNWIVTLCWGAGGVWM